MENKTPKLDLTILYVEDDIDILENVTNYLERRVARVISARNGKEGLTLYNQNKPDLVITDIRMPEMDGIQLSREIKSQNPEALVIIMSAFSDLEYLMTSIQLGINQYILKPMDFNKLNSSIQKAYSIIQSRREHEQRRIELIQAKENAFFLLKTKDQFVRLVAHDLKAPFNNTLELIQILSQLECIQKNAEALELIQQLQTRSQNQLKMIENLLSRERQSSIEMICKLVPTNIFELTQESIQAVEFMAVSKNLKIENQVPENIKLNLDPNLVLEAIKNLLYNAINYSNQNGKIIISYNPKTFAIEVEDNGVGMSQETINKIFTNDISSQIGNLGEQRNGVGLELCKDIMNLHKGQIQIESELGKGTKVSLLFPQN